MRSAGVFFDLYGTLLVYGDMTTAWTAWLEALGNWLRHQGLELDEQGLADRCAGFFSRPAPEAGGDGLTLYEHRLLDLWHRLGTVDGHPPPEALQLRAGAEATIGAWQRFVSVDPEAESVLSELGNTRYLALVSNFDHPPHVLQVVEESGLLPYFDTVTVSAEVGFKKPDPRIFAPALDASGLSPNRVVYIGDAPEDVEGAEAAGLTAIRLERPGDSESDKAADFRHAGPRDWSATAEPLRVATLAELPALLDSL